MFGFNKPDKKSDRRKQAEDVLNALRSCGDDKEATERAVKMAMQVIREEMQEEMAKLISHFASRGGVTNILCATSLEIGGITMSQCASTVGYADMANEIGNTLDAVLSKKNGEVSRTSKLGMIDTRDGSVSMFNPSEN